MTFTVMPRVPRGDEDRPKVLVVDDQQMNRFALAHALKNEPVEVLMAGSGEAALSMLLRHEFAVILLDVRMPGMDGYETARLIHDQGLEPPVPVVFVTADDRTDEGRARGYASGAVDFLYKPIDEMLLLSKVRVFAALDRHRRNLDRVTRALHHSHGRIAQILDAAGEGILGIEPDGRIAFANAAACRLLETPLDRLVGGTSAEAIGLPPASGGSGPLERAASAGSYRSVDSNLVTLRGRRFPAEYSITRLEPDDSGRRPFVMVFQDITERQIAAERLRQEATSDYLTGISNRLTFERELDRRIRAAAVDGTGFALLYMDLNGFKPINDRLGHAVGDELLKGFAIRLRRAMRQDDVCARLGGDEFVVLLAGIGNADAAAHAAESLRAPLVAPYECAGTRLAVGVSIGVAVHPADGSDALALLSAADAAMYRAKRRSKSLP